MLHSWPPTRPNLPRLFLLPNPTPPPTNVLPVQAWQNLLAQADLWFQTCSFGRISLDLLNSVVTPERVLLNCSLAQMDP